MLMVSDEGAAIWRMRGDVMSGTSGRVEIYLDVQANHRFHPTSYYNGSLARREIMENN